MGPERKGENVWFSVLEAAKVLGVTRQAVYAAINAGHLPATDAKYGKKINVENLIGYGIRVGKDPEVLVNRVQEDTGGDVSDLLLWVLGGLGLFFLVKALLGKK